MQQQQCGLWAAVKQCSEEASRSMLTWRCSALSFCSASGVCFKKRSSKAMVEATVSWAANSRVRQLTCSRHKPPQTHWLQIGMKHFRQVQGCQRVHGEPPCRALEQWTCSRHKPTQIDWLQIGVRPFRQVQVCGPAANNRPSCGTFDGLLSKHACKQHMQVSCIQHMCVAQY